MEPAAGYRKAASRRLVSDLGTARGILLAAADQLEQGDLVSVYEGKNRAPESSLIMKVISPRDVCYGESIRSTPKTRRSTGVPSRTSSSGPASRSHAEADPNGFLEDLCSRFHPPEGRSRGRNQARAASGREKRSSKEINDDILAYRTKYGNSLVVYDIGQIRRQLIAHRVARRTRTPWSESSRSREAARGRPRHDAGACRRRADPALPRAPPSPPPRVPRAVDPASNGEASRNAFARRPPRWT